MLSRTVLIVLTGMSVVTACSSSKPSAQSTTSAAGSSSSSSSSASSTTSAPSGGGDCGQGLHAGSGGVVRVFCDGPATAKVTIGSTTTTLSGGRCDEAEGQLAINFGVVVSIDFPKSQPRPDYVGAILELKTGAASAFTARVGGTGGIVLNPKGTVGAGNKSATVSGTLMQGGGAVNVDVTC
jgi:hypothetical protein